MILCFILEVNVVYTHGDSEQTVSKRLDYSTYEARHETKSTELKSGQLDPHLKTSVSLPDKFTGDRLFQKRTPYEKQLIINDFSSSSLNNYEKKGATQGDFKLIGFPPEAYLNTTNPYAIQEKALFSYKAQSSDKSLICDILVPANIDGDTGSAYGLDQIEQFYKISVQTRQKGRRSIYSNDFHEDLRNGVKRAQEERVKFIQRYKENNKDTYENLSREIEKARKERRNR